MAIAKMGLETICMAVDNFDGGNSMSFMAKTYMQIPIIKEPESPIKIRAGWKLNIKKPNSDPAKPTAKRAKGISPVL